MKRIQKFFPFFLLILLAGAGCKKDEYNFNDLPPTVKSFFTVAKADFNIEEEIHFTNASEDADTYTWDFGDGTNSTEKSPKKVYAAPGTYTVILKAVGPGGTGKYSMDLLIIDPNANTGSDKTLYYIEYNAKEIRKISLEPGSASELVASIAGKAGVGLAYDPVDKKIYFSDFTNSDKGKIWRMNEDGTDMQILVDDIDDPYSIALNVADRKIYWADDAGNVGRSNMDGTGVEREFITIAGGNMRGIAFDSKKKVIYFYEVNDEDLYAAKADGTGVGKVISGAFGYSIFVDEENEKLYYEDRNNPAIMRANLDGSGIEKVADVPGTRVHGMAMDYTESKFYWADRDKGNIRRANPDGTGVENFLTGLKNPRGIFIK